MSLFTNRPVTPKNQQKKGCNLAFEPTSEPQQNKQPQSFFPSLTNALNYTFYHFYFLFVLHIEANLLVSVLVKLLTFFLTVIQFNNQQNVNYKRLPAIYMQAPLTEALIAMCKMASLLCLRTQQMRNFIAQEVRLYGTCWHSLLCFHL